MVRITEELLRRKAEHHDGLLTDLEEVSLHQLEIERLEGLGACRKLRILYLQNNVIGRLENLRHAKELRYLNLALNNVRRIEGLSSCEFLSKLDLTVNFIDVDALEASVQHLAPLLHLRELYLMGNPCAVHWEGCRDYVIASLPQLASLDGKDISRSERLKAQQKLKALQAELKALAAAKLQEQGQQPPSTTSDDSTTDDQVNDEEETGSIWSPEARLKAYRKQGEQKAAEEARRRGLEPQKRDYEAEHSASVEATRSKEQHKQQHSRDGGDTSSEPPVRQCNEGRWDFKLEETRQGYDLRLQLSRFMDLSLIDVDVHPSYVSIVVMAKGFRLLWPEEVQASKAVVQRSVTSGELLVSVPVLRARTSGIARGNGAAPIGDASGSDKAMPSGHLTPSMRSHASSTSTTTSATRSAGPRKLADDLLELTGSVDITSIVKQKPDSDSQAAIHSTSRKAPAGVHIISDSAGGPSAETATSSSLNSSSGSTKRQLPVRADAELDLPPLE